MRKIITFNTLLITLLLLIGFNVKVVKAENGVPYITYAEDHKHRLIQTQDAYIPITTYKQFGEYTLKNPEDLFIDKENTVYIADTGNSRIVIIGKNLTDIRTIGEDVLIRPTGLFVDDTGNIYVADFEKSQVFKFDQDGNLIFTYSRPTEPMFGKKTLYRPVKLTVDSRGNLYIISEGTYNGIIQLNHKGEFLGFFGPNDSNTDLRTIVIKSIFPEEIYEKFLNIKPISTSNITIDEKGRIYTVTRGASGDAIKRLNVSGINKLPSNLNDTSYFTAISIGPIGNIYTVADDGYIREYDSEGNLLFQFGGKDERSYYKGLFNMPSDIVSDQSFNLYVLDRTKSELQIFIPTEFSNLVHDAVKLYQDGHYLESKAPWEKVLQANSMFDFAHKGIGQAYFKEGMYEEALKEFKIAGYKQGYSDAYWEIRNEWLTNNLPIILIFVGFIYLLSLINKLIFKVQIIKHQKVKMKTHLFKSKIIRQLFFLSYIKKNPIDAYYGIKREGKTSITSATILYLILFLEKLFSIYYTGFPFNNIEVQSVSLLNEFIKLLGPLFLFVIANYLVCTINDGEGKLKDVYVGTIYAIMPMIFFWPIIVISTQFLTINESFIYTAGMTVLQGWSAILLFLMIKEIHNYTLLDTIKIILITIFTIIIILVSGILLNGLVQQLIDFIRQIVSEVIIRV